MKLCYVTNIWSHHQGEVARCFHELLGGDFKLCLYQPLDHQWSLERISNGWELVPPEEKWIIGPPATASEMSEVHDEMMRYIEVADVVIAGLSPLAPKDFYERRVYPGKLTFFMGERFFKKKITLTRLLNPRFWNMIRFLRKAYNYSNVHFLTMNHYCAADLKLLRLCRDRVWTWGYLTDVPEQPPVERHNKKLRILWCGRMLKWKRVEMIVKAAAQLRAAGCNNFCVELIGEGEMQESITQMIAENELEDAIKILPFQPKNIIREKMRSADIYVFPGGREEGWGAAQPEAMSEGCVVIGNTAAGSTLELIENGVNGFTFDDLNTTVLTDILKRCCSGQIDMNAVGLQAWNTMKQWSPEAGAKKFIRLANAVMSGNQAMLPETGLCSKKESC